MVLSLWLRDLLLHIARSSVGASNSMHMVITQASSWHSLLSQAAASACPGALPLSQHGPGG